jgi:signal transduction histidine kinase
MNPQSPIVPSSPQVTVPENLKPLRVLVVEDRPADARLLIHALEQAGFSPDWRRVETESEYLASLEPTLDLILADYALPQFSGLAALRLMRHRGYRIPFILVTGAAGEEAAVSALHDGADDYLLKDRLARLGQAVARALAERDLRHNKSRVEEELRDAALRLLNQEQAGRAEAEAAVRMRDQFTMIASHELRSPLTAIKVTAQLLVRELSEDGFDPKKGIEKLQRVNEMSDRLTRLITDMLDVTRLRTGQIEMQPELLNLSVLVQQVMDEQRIPLGSDYLPSLKVLGTLPALRADPFRMRQGLANLLENAIKYSPAGGEVEVTLQAHDQGVLVRVSDHGIGLPPDALETIFEPFGRASNAQKHQLPGMGLGLHITRQIVEQHGGRIWADSGGEGLGTRFNVWLPSVALQVARQRPRRVLVVDDEAAIRTALGDLFALEGYECRVAADGREALDQLSGWDADLIVLDLMMPTMDGWAFRREQQSEPAVSEIPVVVMSAHQSDDARDAQLAPAAVIMKPFELDAMVSTVDDIFKREHPSRVVQSVDIVGRSRRERQHSKRVRAQQMR